MPQFSYTAIDASGRRLNQVINAGSKIEVANSLKRNNLFIVEIRELTAKVNKPPKRLPVRDKIFFTQNVSVLLNSGMSLAAALTAIAEDSDSDRIAILYHTIRADLERGFPFSKALGRYPEIFDPIYISLIEAGENSGKLDDVMTNLSAGLERDARTASQVRSAFLYPGFILGTLAVLGTLIMGFVLPKLQPIFSDLKVKLPLTTRLLLLTSKIIITYPIEIVVVMVLLVGGTIFFLRTPKGRTFIGTLSNHLPLIKQMINYLDLSRLASTMALLVSSGIPIQKSLKISSNTIRNPKLKLQIAQTAQQLASGSSLTQGLRQTELPKTFVSLVSVGERSGNIDYIFHSLADQYQERLDSAIKNFTSLIEPALTLIVGVIVGGTVLSILVPIYSIVTSLSGSVK